MYITPIEEFSNLLDEILSIMNSYVKLYNQYQRIFVSSLIDGRQKGSDNTFYESWLSRMDNDLNKELRSVEFMQALSNYLTALSHIIKHSKLYGYDRILEEAISFNLNKHFLNYFASRYKIGDQNNLAYSTAFQVIEIFDNVELIKFTGENIVDIRKPVLLVYAQINRFSIMDLTSDKSVVRNLMSQGLDIYLLKWDNLATYNSAAGLEDYIEYVDKALQTISFRTKIEKIPIVGYCWGGTVSLIYSTLNDMHIQSLTLVASPIDFSKDSSMLAQWSKSLELDQIVENLGHMKGTLLDIAFILRNPPRLLLDKYVKLFQKANDTNFVNMFIAVERWLNNTPDIPGPFYETFIKSLYKDNQLIEGNLKIGSRSVNLKSLDIPIMTVTSVNDDLVSYEATEAVTDYAGSKVEKIQTSGGHVGLCISKKAHEKIWPNVAKWIKNQYTADSKIPAELSENKSVILQNMEKNNRN